MLKLFFNRSKLFLHTVNGASVRFTAARTVNGAPISAPDWVTETPTYKRGIADGSIVDLTPPSSQRKEPDVLPAQPETLAETAPSAQPRKTKSSAVGLQAS